MTPPVPTPRPVGSPRGNPTKKSLNPTQQNILHYICTEYKKAGDIPVAIVQQHFLWASHRRDIHLNALKGKGYLLTTNPVVPSQEAMEWYETAVAP